METLKKFWPRAFRTNSVAELVAAIVIYVLINVASAIVEWALGILPLIGTILGAIWGIIGWVIGIYCTVGIVLAILAFCKVLK